MNLNKHKNKRNKLTYDASRIILKGVKELYAFVYKRTWDLTQYDKDVLEKYDLKKAEYVYIGSSDDVNLRRRCNTWKADIKRNKNVSEDIIKFINNLKKFYELETNYTTKEIEYLLYYNTSVIARCESLQSARKLEKHYTTNYHQDDSFGEILETQIILLSKKDSNLKEIKDGEVAVLKVKNKVA